MYNTCVALRDFIIAFQPANFTLIALSLSHGHKRYMYSLTCKRYCYVWRIILSNAWYHCSFFSGCQTTYKCSCWHYITSISTSWLSKCEFKLQRTQVFLAMGRLIKNKGVCYCVPTAVSIFPEQTKANLNRAGIHHNISKTKTTFWRSLLQSVWKNLKYNDQVLKQVDQKILQLLYYLVEQKKGTLIVLWAEQVQFQLMSWQVHSRRLTLYNAQTNILNNGCGSIATNYILSTASKEFGITEGCTVLFILNKYLLQPQVLHRLDTTPTQPVMSPTCTCTCISIRPSGEQNKKVIWYTLTLTSWEQVHSLSVCAK